MVGYRKQSSRRDLMRKSRLWMLSSTLRISCCSRAISRNSCLLIRGTFGVIVPFDAPMGASLPARAEKNRGGLSDLCQESQAPDAGAPVPPILWFSVGGRGHLQQEKLNCPDQSRLILLHPVSSLDPKNT